jgi:hypothetical protein
MRLRPKLRLRLRKRSKRKKRMMRSMMRRRKRMRLKTSKLDGVYSPCNKFFHLHELCIRGKKKMANGYSAANKQTLEEWKSSSGK